MWGKWRSGVPRTTTKTTTTTSSVNAPWEDAMAVQLIVDRECGNSTPNTPVLWFCSAIRISYKEWGGRNVGKRRLTWTGVENAYGGHIFAALQRARGRGGGVVAASRARAATGASQRIVLGGQVDRARTVRLMRLPTVERSIPGRLRSRSGPRRSGHWSWPLQLLQLDVSPQFCITSVDCQISQNKEHKKPQDTTRFLQFWPPHNNPRNSFTTRRKSC